ncbi:MAG: hypothetical protein OEV14_06070 [Gammaproteobacteria bacterium]|nr:hypothetical protein [Gammaproteobacteria bacterium]
MIGESGNLGFVEDAARRLDDTLSTLRSRAVTVEEGLRQRATAVEGQLQQRATAVEAKLQQRATGAPGSFEAKYPDPADVEAYMRSVVAYIRDNPLPAALLAIGAGVIATSIWSKRNGGSRLRGRR